MSGILDLELTHHHEPLSARVYHMNQGCYFAQFCAECWLIAFIVYQSSRAAFSLISPHEIDRVVVVSFSEVWSLFLSSISLSCAERMLTSMGSVTGAPFRFIILTYTVRLHVATTSAPLSLTLLLHSLLPIMYADSQRCIFSWKRGMWDRRNCWERQHRIDRETLNNVPLSTWQYKQEFFLRMQKQSHPLE